MFILSGRGARHGQRAIRSGDTFHRLRGHRSFKDISLIWSSDLFLLEAFVVKPTRPLLILAAAGLSAAAAQAQDTPFVLGTIVLSPSLTPVELGSTGANVEVLEGDDVGADDTRVIDRLTRLPGVNLTSNGGLGALATLQVRGLPARYVSTRINGIDVSDPSGTQNQFNFGGLTSTGLARAELLKGSQSALYGSSAIAGVVNLTTFRPEVNGFSGNAQIEGGSFGTYSGGFSVGSKTDTAEIALSYGYVESDGISARSSDTEEDGFQQDTLNLTAEADLSDTVTVGGAIYYRDSDIEIDRSRSDSSGDISSEELGARIFATLQTGAVSHTLSYNYFDIERLDPGGFTTRFSGTRDTVSYLGTATLSDTTILNFGFDHTSEDIDSGVTVGKETNNAAKLEVLFSPSGQVDLSAALRYDDNSSFGGELTGRLAAAWRPMEDLTVRAVLGTGYRSPSLFERFSSFGDPSLQPETSTSFELGVEKTYGDVGFVKATLFRTEIDDLIDFDGASVACGSGFGCYNQVDGTTTAQGVEISGEVALSDMFAVYGAYTYTDSKTNGSRLTRTPRHDLSVGLSGDFNDRLSGYVDVRHVADVVPSAFAPAGHKVGDYTIVGAGVSFDVTPQTEAYLRVENLFDEDYETAGGFNQPGRAAFFGIRAQF